VRWQQKSDEIKMDISRYTHAFSLPLQLGSEAAGEAKGLAGSLVTAGAGALAAAAGIYLFKKVKAKFKGKKPKMKLSQRDHLSLSTRCTWLISGTRIFSSKSFTFVKLLCQLTV
jgi:hypothetical protein